VLPALALLRRRSRAAIAAGYSDGYRLKLPARMRGTRPIHFEFARNL
jgi:hypothetical protein